MIEIIKTKLKAKLNEKPNAEFIDKTISFEKEDLPQVFRIVSNTKLTEKDPYFNMLLKPLNLKLICKPKQYINNEIDTFYYYSSNLIDVEKLKDPPYHKILMPNLYDTKIHIPILIQNYIKLIDKPFKQDILSYNNNIGHFWDVAKNKNLIPVINYIYKNHKNCGYDFIEVIDYTENKLTVYIYPSNLLDEINPKKKYLDNFMYLDYTSIPMLKVLQELYSNNNYMCFVHQQLSVHLACLHFHIIKKTLYKRHYSNLELGAHLLQDIYIEELINNLTVNPNYYLEYYYSLIRD
jgi:hypothetical protein